MVALLACGGEEYSAGFQVTSRCEQVEGLRTDSVEEKAFEREIQQFIPPPGSHTESAHLKRLREIQGKIEQRGSSSSTLSSSTSASSSHPEGRRTVGGLEDNSSDDKADRRHMDRRRRFVTYEKDKNGCEIETELYWSGNRLVWSRAGVPIRAFSYEEQVKCACWTWMDATSALEEDRTLGRARMSPSDNVRGDGERREAAGEGQTSSARPTSLASKPPDWRMKKSFRPTQKRARDGTFRALCVFLPSCMVAYHPHSGQEYLKRLDLSVMAVFPLDVGLLIQRQTEAEDRKRYECIRGGQSASVDPPLANLFYLRRPFDELRAVDLVDQIRFSREEEFSFDSGSTSSSSSSVGESAKTRSFNEVDEKVIMVSLSPPVMVTTSIEGRCIRIYAYVHGGSPLQTHHTDRADEVVRSAETTTTSKAQAALPSSGLPLSRRSTTEGPRPRPSTRPRLPPRKSARLESGSGRSSMGGGGRSSLAGEMSRAASGSGHTRRTSAGMASLYGPSPLLQGEDDTHRDTDDENMQDVMQLLDEFDEAEEEASTQLQQQQQQQQPFSTGQVSGSHRRRASRATGAPLTALSAPSNTTVATARTPHSKSRTMDERRISRSRMSTSVAGVGIGIGIGIGIEGAPSSLAMELSQKDEASKMAMTASSDKAMSRGISSEGVGLYGDTTTQTESLSLFQHLSQSFAAVSLLEEIAVPELLFSEQADQIKAFVHRTGGLILVRLVLPFCSRMMTRQIEEKGDRVMIHQYTLRSLTPAAHLADAEVEVGDAFIVNGRRREDLLLLQQPDSTAMHIVAGAPGPMAVSARLQVPIIQAEQLYALPVEMPVRGLGRLTLQTEPLCPLTARVMALCERVLEARRFRELQMAWITSQPKNERHQWDVLSDLLLDRQVREASDDCTPRRKRLDRLLGPLASAVKTVEEIEGNASPVSQKWSREEMKSLVEALHWAAQEATVGLCRRKVDTPRLALLITTFAYRLGWPKCFDFWIRLLPTGVTVGTSNEMINSTDEADLIDIFDLLRAESVGQTLTVPENMLEHLPMVQRLASVYSAFAPDNYIPRRTLLSGGTVSSALQKSISVVQAMLDNHLELGQLKHLSPSLTLPLYAAIKDCQRDPPTRWNARAYTYIGRNDIAKQMSPDSSAGSRDDDFALTNDRQSSRLFTGDYRLKEVGEMLQTIRPVAVRVPDAAVVEDQELIAEKQKRVFVSASDRIRALSVGRGMYGLASVAFKSTEQWKTHPLCLRLKMLNNCIIQHKEPDAESAEMEWPEFHNGVASALQLSTINDQIDSSWLYNQLNKEFNSRHAGFMFGVGLLGQLKHLGKIHAYFYLNNRHQTTTIGLLLGISLSLMGSRDSLAKALMSIHLIHTLPTHSRPLKTSMLEQSAALVGLGFVFLASKDRWASRMALKAIGTEYVLTDDSQMLKRECYSLSAAISLGLTCLGRGRDKDILSNELEEEIVPTLEKLIKGFTRQPANGVEAQEREKVIDKKQYSAFEWAPDVSLTTTPASIALALVYLKSNRKDKSGKMPLPENVDQLDSIRPEMLTIRAICRSLIEWDDIEASHSWLLKVLPAFLQFDSVKAARESSESCQMAFWSLRLGSLFAIALKYAGSNNPEAKACLMEQLHIFQSQIDVRPSSFFEKIRQQMLQSSTDVILTCLTLVLAGTGDVVVLQHLRKALYRVDTLRYGNYMATSMAIGMLFLGAGRFTLASTDVAIASLLISFYPRFPVNSSDNRCHLQAYRHLWHLAVEARLLSVEDADSGESTRMPVELERKTGERTSLSAPCLLPRLGEVRALQVASDRYFTSRIVLEKNKELQRNLAANRKLYVKRKAADLSFEEDRWGKSSLRARTSGISGRRQLPVDPGSRPVDEAPLRQGQHHAQTRQELRKLIEENVHDEDVLTLVDLFMSNKGEDEKNSQAEEALELMMLQSIVECLLDDKREMLPTMVTLHSSTQSFLRQVYFEDDFDGLRHLLFLQDLREMIKVTQVQQKSSGASSHGRRSLLDSAYLNTLWSLMQDKMVEQLMKATLPLREDLRHYAKSISSSSSSVITSAWSVRQRPRLACLLYLSQAPPLALLSQVRAILTARQPDVRTKGEDRDVATALLKDVLSQMGCQVRVEVLHVIVEAWLE